MDQQDKDVKASKMIKLHRKLVYDIEYHFNQFSLNTVGFMEYNNKLIIVEGRPVSRGDHLRP